ncbi:MAG: hypothetical protein PW789_01745 [Edaphobacter sp.]|uniref:hypothetical protein n=1 Tax=Edaphobacter sp. TaxID=1934404 RepID=UPI0023A4EF84|nr:hypothetical protein [Edaphobacter sp.]MDE1175312.1 hypothetical protein [Edaphobacter sp.]
MHIDKKNRMRSVGSVFILLLLTDCRHAKQSEIVVDKYLRVAVALSERDPDALDYYVGPKELLKAVEKSPPTLSDIALQITQLQKELPASGMERARRDALAAQLNAMALRVQALQGRYVSFDAESRGYFDIEATPYDKQQERVAIR